jgi:TfoX/Sxy family transcriptional regulator of competence genes
VTTDELAAAVRDALSKSGTIREVNMFGGIGFMLNGNMVAAASKRGLLARVGNDQAHDALQLPGTPNRSGSDPLSFRRAKPSRDRTV